MRNVAEWFSKEMVVLAEAYGVALTAERIRIYAAELSDLTPEQVHMAMSAARRECRYFPSIAEIRQHAVPAGDDSAMLAWAGFHRAASVVGSWSNLVVHDPAAATALLSVFGSWPGFCELDRISAHSKRQEFMAAYRHARRSPATESVRVLLGLAASASDDVASPPATTWLGEIDAKTGEARWIQDTGQYKAVLDGPSNERLALREARAEEEAESAEAPSRVASHSASPRSHRKT